MTMSRYDAIKCRREATRKAAEDCREWKEKLALVQAHRETKLLGRESNPGAWEYVEAMFPTYRDVIAQTKVYKNDNTHFCSTKLGIPIEAGGVFFPKAGAIVVCWTRGLTDDVVIVHEMLHYIRQCLGSRFYSRLVEEDFAYTKSIRYLLSKGYQEKWIRETYMLPHYFSMEMIAASKPGAKLTNAQRDAAKSLALKKVGDLYKQEIEGVSSSPEPDDDGDRFDFL